MRLLFFRLIPDSVLGENWLAENCSQQYNQDYTPVRGEKEVLPWNLEARTALDDILETFPPLIRISVAKRLRDGAERVAVDEGLDEVGIGEVERARSSLLTGAPA